MNDKRRFILIMLLLLLGSVQLGGCYYVRPAPVVPATSYDVVWDSALRAAEEVDVQIISVDNGAGIIYGKKGSTDVRVIVTRQYDGKTRVELDMKGEKLHTQSLADDFFRAYDRYMGRR